MGIIQKTSFICFCILLVITPGCFIPQGEVLNSKQLENRIKDLNDSQIKYEEEISKKIIYFVFEIDSLNQAIINNKTGIKTIKDSLMVYQQLDLSFDTSEDDIINSLIRIQSKLNVIEEKLFIYDSLYFDTLNELIRVEERMGLLETTDIEVTTEKSNADVRLGLKVNADLHHIHDLEKQYMEGYNYYQQKKYDEAIIVFREIISQDPFYVNSDNSQFWIGQIYFLRKEYSFAIVEYEKVFSLGDKNKVPDADYKIAISYKMMGQKDKSVEKLNEIIQKYTDNTKLLLKAKKELKNIN